MWLVNLLYFSKDRVEQIQSWSNKIVGNPAQGDEKVEPESKSAEASPSDESSNNEKSAPEGKPADEARNGETTESPSTGDAEKAKETAAETAPSVEQPSDKAKLAQHHVAKILDDVLEEPRAESEKHGYKHPMILDVILAIGLLVAMGGFTIGLINIYITHQAEQSIMQRNYKAAISVLKGAPLSGFFTIPGSDPNDLLNQALYLDAMEKLDANGEDVSALKELEKIPAGSRYFDIAQDILKEHFKPSDTQLEGSAEHVATPAEAVAPKKPILPPEEETGPK